MNYSHNYSIKWILTLYIITCNSKKGRDKYMRDRKLIWFIMILFVGLVTACQKEIIDTEIYEILEETVEIEDSLQEIREEMANLEEEENELYKQLIDQPLNDLDLLAEYVEKAEKLIDQREKLLEKEHSAMTNSKEQFIQIEPLIDQIEKETAQKSAKDMYEIMLVRYDIYEEWYDAYVHRLSEEANLYALFLENKIDFEQVNEQVEVVNTTYDEAKIILNNFSEQTTTYNQAKIDYYEKSELNIAID